MLLIRLQKTHAIPFMKTQSIFKTNLPVVLRAMDVLKLYLPLALPVVLWSVVVQADVSVNNHG